MTYEEARALIQEHLDYGGSLDSHGLAVAMSAPSASIADTALKEAGEKEVTKAVGNLLARIHRDGGHYQAEHGTLKALEDAEREVVHMLSIADTAGAKPSKEQERENFKKAFKHLDMSETKNAWDEPVFVHSHIEALFAGWMQRSFSAAPPAPSSDTAGAKPVDCELTDAAIRMLKDAGCSEVADDFALIGNIDVMVLLSNQAVEDLNRQARERDYHMGNEDE